MHDLLKLRTMHLECTTRPLETKVLASPQTFLSGGTKKGIADLELDKAKKGENPP